MKLMRFAGNPILTPRSDSLWENACACNPGAWFDGTKVRLLYRGGADTDEHRICFGLAESSDGFHFERVSDQPVFEPSGDGFDGGCVEDARIVKFGDMFFVTYAARMFPPGAYWRKRIPLNAFNPVLPKQAPVAARENLTRTGLAATEDFRSWHRFGPITRADVDDRDVILFPKKVEGKFAMLHRPATWVGPQYGCKKPSMWLSFGTDMLVWKEEHLLAQPAFPWEAAKVGSNAPPIQTDAGWLVLYHGVDAQHAYRVGAMLLDLKDPRRVIGRTPEPILEPEAPWERQGLVPNVVFPCGNVVIGDQLLVYYGGADRVCCMATCRLDALVEHLLENCWIS